MWTGVLITSMSEQGASLDQPLWIGVVSIFPEMFQALTEYGICGRAFSRQRAEIHCFNPRDFTEDAYRRIDDRPFGGGPGMVMLPEPLAQAIQAARNQAVAQGYLDVPVIYLSPQGQTFSEQMIQARKLTAWRAIILLCGRYEGVDERLIANEVDEEWSLGDFVLSGGELAAMTILDSLIRRLPGVMQDNQSAVEDSFVDGWLDCAHYTRPEIWRNQPVPSILLSGHHAHIEQWRFVQRYQRTRQRRPDLIDETAITSQQRRWIRQFSDEE